MKKVEKLIQNVQMYPVQFRPLTVTTKGQLLISNTVSALLSLIKDAS